MYSDSTRLSLILLITSSNTKVLPFFLTIAITYIHVTLWIIIATKIERPACNRVTAQVEKKVHIWDTYSIFNNIILIIDKMYTDDMLVYFFNCLEKSGMIDTILFLLPCIIKWLISHFYYRTLKFTKFHAIFNV